jgi:hypothetical protein
MFPTAGDPGVTTCGDVAVFAGFEKSGGIWLKISIMRRVMWTKLLTSGCEDQL